MSDVLSQFYPELDGAYSGFLLGSISDVSPLFRKKDPEDYKRVSAYMVRRNPAETDSEHVYLEDYVRDFLLDNTQSREQLLCISGKAGVGKSTFIRYCLRFYGPYDINSKNFSGGVLNWETLDNPPELWPTWDCVRPFVVDFSKTPRIANVHHLIATSFIDQCNQYVVELGARLDDGVTFVEALECLNELIQNETGRPLKCVVVLDNADLLSEDQILDTIKDLRNLGIITVERPDVAGHDFPGQCVRVLFGIRDETYRALENFIQSFGDNCARISLEDLDKERLVDSRNLLAVEMAAERKRHYERNFVPDILKDSDASHHREQHVLIDEEETLRLLRAEMNVRIVSDSDEEREIGAHGEPRIDSQSLRFLDLLANGSTKKFLKIWRQAVHGKIARDRVQVIQGTSGVTQIEIRNYYFLCSILCIDRRTYSPDSPILNIFNILSEKGAVMHSHHLLVGFYFVFAMIESKGNLLDARALLLDWGFENGLIMQVESVFLKEKLLHKFRGEFVFAEMQVFLAHDLVIGTRAYIDTMAASMADSLKLENEMVTDASRPQFFIKRVVLAVEFLERVLKLEHASGLRCSYRLSGRLISKYLDAINYLTTPRDISDPNKMSRLAREVRKDANWDEWQVTIEKLENMKQQCGSVA